MRVKKCLLVASLMAVARGGDVQMPFVGKGSRAHNLAQASLDMVAFTCWDSPQRVCAQFSKCNLTCTKLILSRASWSVGYDNSVLYKFTGAAECGSVHMSLTSKPWIQTLHLTAAVVNGTSVHLDWAGQQ